MAATRHGEMDSGGFLSNVGVSMPAAGRPRDRDRPLLVMVSGPPGSGKSTLAGEIGTRTCLPVVSRDALKGGICFTAGAVPPDIAARTGEVFWPLLTSLLAARVSVVAEWALHRRFAAEHLSPLSTEADIRLIVCTAPREVLLRRVAARADADPLTRWPFPDAASRALLADPEKSLDDFHDLRVPVPSLTVRTDDGYAPAIPDIVEFCLAEKGDEVTRNAVGR